MLLNKKYKLTATDAQMIDKLTATDSQMIDSTNKTSS
jgi:hypothetical protein